MLSRNPDQTQGAAPGNDQVDREKRLQPAKTQFAGPADASRPHGAQRPGLKTKTRSEGQAEASRRNGIHTRGPTTAEGRNNSRRKAFRHGLLAYRIQPLEQDAELQREYELHRKGLIKEFDPMTTTEWAAVETLASDLVQQGRIIEMREALCHLDHLIKRTGLAIAPDYRGDAKVVEKLIGRVKKGLELRCSEDDVDWLADFIVAEVEELNRHVAPIRDCRNEGGKLMPGEKPFLADMDFISKLGVLKVKQVARVLRGARRVEQDKRKPWLLLLKRIKETLEGCADSADENDASNNSSRRRAWHPLASHIMPTLDSLERYHTRLRQSIERSITYLDKRLARRQE